MTEEYSKARQSAFDKLNEAKSHLNRMWHCLQVARQSHALSRQERTMLDDCIKQWFGPYDKIEATAKALKPQ